MHINTHQKVHIEGSRPEWCISSMIYSRDTPFWSGTLDIHLILIHRALQNMFTCHKIHTHTQTYIYLHTHNHSETLPTSIYIQLSVSIGGQGDVEISSVTVAATTLQGVGSLRGQRPLTEGVIEQHLDNGQQRFLVGSHHLHRLLTASVRGQDSSMIDSHKNQSNTP